MITFKTKENAVWVSGNDKDFNDTEIGHYSVKDRQAVGFKLRPYTPVKVREIREANQKTVDVKGMTIHQLMADPGVDPVGVVEDAVKYVVEDWKGVLDENGNPMPCTDENKLLLARKGYPKLASAWVEIARYIMSRHEQYREETKVEDMGNSDASQNG